MGVNIGKTDKIVYINSAFDEEFYLWIFFQMYKREVASIRPWTTRSSHTNSKFRNRVCPENSVQKSGVTNRSVSIQFHHFYRATHMY